MQDTLAGLDVLLREGCTMLEGQRVGLLTNHSSLTRSRTHSLDALLAANVNVRALFAPEHGIRGVAPAGEDVPSSVDPKTGLPVHSLYGPTRKPTPDVLQDVDVLLFDIQDVGARFYTYLYTMAYAMQSAAAQGRKFFLLDRPNPIGGISVEGPVLKPRFSSFVGLYPIPVRTGMTIGELAQMFNNYHGIGADLTVVPLEGWRREMWFDETGLPWVPPSPGIRTLDAAAIYPGTCLLEGTNVSEGRGTQVPFQTIGAPWIDGQLLQERLTEAGLPGVDFEPVSFVPEGSKFAGERCGGVFIRVSDRELFTPVLMGVKIIELIRALYPDDFTFNPPGPDGRRFFDLLAGTDHVRTMLEAGTSAEQISDSWKAEVSGFESVRKAYLLYR